MTGPNLPADFDFTDPDIYAARLPVEEFAQMRATCADLVEPPPPGGGYGDEGYWVLSKRKDVKQVSLRSDIFSSWENGAIPWPPDQVDAGQMNTQQDLIHSSPWTSITYLTPTSRRNAMVVR
jgi:cholest-4-en-3-one 26-monooxygenase